MKLGTTWIDITPDKPIDVMGQMHVRKGEYARDPLTVNAGVFEDAGKRVAIVSADVCVVTNDIDAEIRRRLATAGVLGEDELILAATHTHVGPMMPDTNIPGQADDAWVERFMQAVVEVVRKAIDDLEEVTLWSGNGEVDLGWNRRGLKSDGSCEMYHNAYRPDFAGIEGPRDTHLGVLWARRADASIKLVMSSFASHCNSLSAGNFFSADLPGEVRKQLRTALGEKTGVLYLTGAAGDIDIILMDLPPGSTQPWRFEQGVKMAGVYLAGQILHVINTTRSAMDQPTLSHAHEVISLATRPWDAHFDPHTLPDGGMKDFCVKSQNDWDRLLREEPAMPVRVHVVRLGDAALCFNPAELFCAFGLDIKRKSPAVTTIIGELSNGWCGYIPTAQAIRHGGYSARSSSHTRCIPQAGSMIVETTDKLLSQMF